MKWVIILLVVGIGIAILTDNMGGARDAAANYNNILRPDK